MSFIVSLPSLPARPPASDVDVTLSGVGPPLSVAPGAVSIDGGAVGAALAGALVDLALVVGDALSDVPPHAASSAPTTSAVVTRYGRARRATVEVMLMFSPVLVVKECSAHLEGGHGLVKSKQVSVGLGNGQQDHHI
jgi:hypothetical protein